MVLGGGAVPAAEEARALAERLDMPVINTVNAKGILPPDHPLRAGENMAWPPVREALRAADVVLAVGCEFGETEMYPGPEPLRFDGELIRIDLDPEQLVRRFPADLPILGDSWPRRCAPCSRPCPMRPGATAPRARRHCARRCRRCGGRPCTRTSVCSAWFGKRCRTRSWSAISTEPVYAGNQFFAPDQPRSWFNSSTGYGTLGYGLPAAVGAKLAAPGRPVVALVGDGGLQYTLPELASAVEAGAPVIVLVWNNRAYGEIRSYMVEHGIEPIGVELHTPDLVAVARGYGCAAERATSLDHLAALLAEAAGRECADPD